MKFDEKKLGRRTAAVTRAMKTVFLLCFAVMIIYGIYPKKRQYVPTVVSEPVFSHTFEAEPVENPDFGEEIYVFAPTVGKTVLPSVSAQAAALISGDTGELIFGRNSDIILPMASTTKIMTALVVLENCDVNSVFTVPPEVCGVEGSSIYLYPGEKITIRDLLYGLLLESGNDAAEALAVACGGNVENFVKLMNEKARELGLVRTSFANPHGLSAEGHYTTALELAKITYHAMKNPLFCEITATKNYNVRNDDGTPSHYFVNHNRLLRSYEGANGVKTGYTIASGRCLVTSARRDGNTYIAVTLNDRNDWKDHAVMLDFAFANYECKRLIESGEIVFNYGGRRYTNKEGAAIVKRKDGGEKDKFSVSVVLE